MAQLGVRAFDTQPLSDFLILIVVKVDINLFILRWYLGIELGFLIVP